MSMRLGEPRPAEPELLTPGLSAGVGYSIAHHGELLQGVFDDGAGRLRRALVTMPLPGRAAARSSTRARATGAWWDRRG